MAGQREAPKRTVESETSEREAQNYLACDGIVRI